MYEDILAPFPVSDRPFEEVLREAEIRSQNQNRRLQDPRYMERLIRVATLLESLYNGRTSPVALREVMSTSDFPVIYGDILDRQMLAGYAETPASWSMYASRGVVRDFRSARRIALDGLEGPFVPAFQKNENGNVQYDNTLQETPYSTQVQVYEKAFSHSWRMLINDDMNAMRRLPMRLARGSRRTEERFCAGLYMGSAGPNATFFSNANRNLINIANGAASNNPALSVQGLRDAFNVFSRQTDFGGDPIIVDGAVLVVPPALEITAREILKAMAISFNPGATAGASFATANWIGEKLRLAVNYYAPVVNTTNGHTAWYVFAEPNANRPALEMTFLSGYENPMLLQKAPNTQRVGGGLDPMLGDFEDMTQKYKGVHILGGTLLDPKAALVSLGTGS